MPEHEIDEEDDWIASLPFRGPRAFPVHLAQVVAQRWNHVCGGSYVTPPGPPEELLREVLEVAYLAASAPEEDRFPRFNLVCLSKTNGASADLIGNRWKFAELRELSVSELRRLAPASDLRKSAIWLEWHDSKWKIAGLIDLGTSWSRARAGLEYHYRIPACLLIEVDRPGRLRVYQGQFHVASLTDGIIDVPFGIDMHLSLHATAGCGLDTISDEILRPKIEHPREYENFEFIAMWNTYAAIANSISLLGHGGAIIIVPEGTTLSHDSLKIKYSTDAHVLRSSFIKFINARHIFGDLAAREDQGDDISEYEMSHAALKSSEAFTELVEATRFVAQLSGCDGAVVISEGLRLLGFGAEISAELKDGTVAFDVIRELSRGLEPLNVEQFGMRHRSAIKLVSQHSDVRVLVVSQDGPISSVWYEKDAVHVRRNVNLVNMNMPWA
jgi:hypothetical protein